MFVRSLCLKLFDDFPCPWNHAMFLIFIVFITEKPTLPISDMQAEISNVTE